MTREEQQSQDKRYADWYKVYVEEQTKPRHWGDRHKRPNAGTGSDTMQEQAEQGEL